MSHQWHCRLASITFRAWALQKRLQLPVQQRAYKLLHMSAQAAREAYRSFLLAYNSHQLKSIFNVHRLDLVAVAKSFGFSAPPKVHTAPDCPAPCTTAAMKLMRVLAGSRPDPFRGWNGSSHPCTHVRGQSIICASDVAIRRTRS